MSDAVAMDDLVEAMSRRGTPMTPESALFIVLQAVESMKDRRMVLDAGGIEVDENGLVKLNELCSPAVDDREAQEGVATLLETALSPTPPTVQELTAKLRSETVFTHSALAAELAAALVPLNRGAAQRMLGRLVREHHRPARPEESDDAAADADEKLTRGLDEKGADPSASADATEPDAAVRDDWDRPVKKGPSTVQALVMLGLSTALLGAAAVFLWSRLRG
jgi:hypothetical protein